MTISTRFALGISAAALSLSLGVTSAALAQDASAGGSPAATAIHNGT